MEKETIVLENDQEVLPPAYRGILSPDIKVVSLEEYWKRQATMGRIVEPLNKLCGDCAITTGFYVDHAKSLAKQSKELQSAVLDRWFCHNNCNRGCKGVREFLEKHISDGAEIKQ